MGKQGKRTTRRSAGSSGSGSGSGGGAKSGGGGGRGKKKSAKRPIDQYEHADKQRVNIPPVGLVTPYTDPPPEALPVQQARKTYQYDPHLDPQLIWAGKAERTSFEVPTVSLHVHERIDPRTIIEQVRARNGNGHSGDASGGQLPLFGRPEQNPPLRDAVDFYRHRHNWTNRLIAGDSLLVMNSLLEKEGLGGQVQMVYIDPPYGIRYGSNFQPFVNKRDVKDGSDDDLTLEPETLKAFRDTWELGIHSYLTYLRDRLFLAKELLHESGSCFVQISDENIHHVRELMDEVFGAGNLCSLIAFRTTGGQSTALLASSTDYLVWYAKDKEQARRKFRQLTRPKEGGNAGSGQYTLVEPRTGKAVPRAMTKVELRDPDTISDDLAILSHDTLYSQGAPSDPADRVFSFNGSDYTCPPNTHWKASVKGGGMQRLADAGRIMLLSDTLRYKRYLDDYPVVEIDNVWNDTATSGFARKKQYIVETNVKVIERCLLMTTDPGDLVLDPTCGSGTMAYVAEQWGRRWITTDTSRVAITLAKQRLMTATFDYYTLAHPAPPHGGVGSGFKYKSVPHVTLKSIANNPEITPGKGMTREQIDKAIAKYADVETLYDQPEVDNKRARVTGPFTVEAVPAAAWGVPEVKPIGEPQMNTDQHGSEGASIGVHPCSSVVDASIAREGETLRQSQWRDELLKTGIRAKGGAKIEFVRVEALPGTRWLSADAETKEGKPRRAVVSFGPEHAPLEQRQVAKALEEAYTLVPKPSLVIFAALQFDPEAAKDIDETNWPGVTMLKVQMNGDLVTEDLKKKRASNESFWLVGQPDVEVRRHRGTEASRDRGAKGQGLRGQEASRDREGAAYVVEVHGFDYYNPRSGKVESGGSGNIAMWMLDPDYDGRSLYPRQVFFPMSGAKDGWSRLAKNLKAEIDPELIEQYRGTVSLPFEKGAHGRIAVKIVDDRGIESLRVMELG